MLLPNFGKVLFRGHLHELIHLKHLIHVLIGIIFVSALGLVSFAEMDAGVDLDIVQISLNDKFDVESEAYMNNGNVYIPLYQVGSLLDIEFQTDEGKQNISFKNPTDGTPIKIDLINSVIELNGSVLDRSDLSSIIFSARKAFVIDKRDILLSAKLLEKMFDVKIEYKEDSMTLAITVNRQVKVLKKRIKFGEEKAKKEIEYKKPKKEKVSLRNFQVGTTSQSVSTSSESPSDSTSKSDFSTTTNIGVMGEVFGGIYKTGPAFIQKDDYLTFSRLDQIWQRKFNENFALSLGNISPSISRLTMPGTQVLGFTMGSPSKLDFKKMDTLSFQGVCQTDAEVLLLLNSNRIARQICKEGKYDFQNIPRLINPDNKYSIVQNNTDGTSTVLKEEVLSFFHDLIPKGEKEWEFSFGKPPEQFNIDILGKNPNQTDSPKKLLVGSGFRYGLSERVNVGISASADPFFGKALGSTSSTNEEYAPETFNTSQTQGTTASVSLTARPTNSLGFNLETAISGMRDLSEDRIYQRFGHDGLGLAALLDMDYRKKIFSTQGSLFYISPSFYSPSGIQNNRMGFSLSNSLSFKGQAFNMSLNNVIENMDGKGRDGKENDFDVNIFHSTMLPYNISWQNKFKYKREESEKTFSDSVDLQTSFQQRINKNLSLRVSGSLINSTSGKENKIHSLDSTLSIGGTYRFNENNSLNFGLSAFPERDGKSLFLQYRKNFQNGKLKNISYEPSIQIFSGKSDEYSWSLSNGLYWQKSDGTRLGIQYIYSNSSNPVKISSTNTNTADETSETRSGKSKTTNHTIYTSLNTNIGVFDKRLHLISNAANAGYLTGKVFLDLNDNGKQDPDEKALNGIELNCGNKKTKTDLEGKYSFVGLSRGLYQVSVNVGELPFTISLIDGETEHLKIEAGKVTEVEFRATVNSGSVSGRIYVRSVDGQKRSPENIIVVAYDEATKKEVAYTYADASGYYELSELRPGKYKIMIDPGEVRDRKLTFAEGKNEYTVSIPLNLEELIEIQDIDFDATKELF